jgi:hypothetical protein
MRKLIMTVLTLALILGSISVASAASGKVKLTDIADSANEEAIQVAYDLNIVEGTPEGAYEPEKAINRAEFAALITRALAIPESALASYTGSTFKDTSGYTWASKYLAFCQEKGIMKGDGYGNAMPGRTISPNEAVTMILRAIGYTDNASVLVGQWPANYVSLGQSFLIYNNVSPSTELDKANAAQMLYNALTVQLVQVDANSTVIQLWDRVSATREDPRSLLTAGLDCRYVDERVVTYTDASASKINLIPRVGAYGVLYKSNKDDEVVALTEVETQFIAGKFTYTSLEAPNKFKAVDGTEYNLSGEAKELVRVLANGGIDTYVKETTTTSAITNETTWDEFYYFVNGDDRPGFDSDRGDRYIYKDKDTSIPSKLVIAARVSGVTILDLRSVAVWDATGIPKQGATFLYESGQINGKKFNGHNFPLDVNNEVDDYGYDLKGVDSLDDLAADNVIYLYKNYDEDIIRIEVGTETQSGAITNVNMSDNQRTIGGKVLGLSPYASNADGYSSFDGTEDVNNEGTALLDVYGRLYDFQLGEASKGNFAVITGVGMGTFGDVQYKLFDKTGNEVVYGITGKAKYNGGYISKAADGASPNPDLTDTNIKAGDFGSEGDLVEYKLSGGKISELDSRYRSYPADGTSTDKNWGTVNKAGTILTPTGRSGIVIDSSVLVYVEDDNDYSIGNIKDLLDTTFTESFQYIVDGTSKTVRALVVSKNDAGAQNVFVVMNNITVGADTSGEFQVVHGLSFADGVGAEVKTWNYIDDGLRSALYIAGDAKGPFARIVKFRIGEDNILRGAAYLDTVTDGNPIGDTTDPDHNAHGVIYKTGNAGTFTLAYTTSSSISNADVIADPTLATLTVAFEANAVYYKIEGTKWVAYKPDSSVFKTIDEGNGYYIFLKSDPKKDYDIIIKTPNPSWDPA